MLGNIDIVVNNAGILDERRWEKEIAVNIVSVSLIKMQQLLNYLSMMLCRFPLLPLFLTIFSREEILYDSSHIFCVLNNLNDSCRRIVSSRV